MFNKYYFAFHFTSPRSKELVQLYMHEDELFLVYRWRSWAQQVHCVSAKPKCGERLEWQLFAASMRPLGLFPEWCLTSNTERKMHWLGTLTQAHEGKMTSDREAGTSLTMCSSQPESSLHAVPVQSGQPASWRDAPGVISICCSSEGLALVASTLVEWLPTAYNSSSIGSDALFWPLWGTRSYPDPLT